jgi:predicted outer membrane repeat protein
LEQEELYISILVLEHSIIVLSQTTLQMGLKEEISTKGGGAIALTTISSALYFYSSSRTFNNYFFTNNSAKEAGGALHFLFSSSYI